MKYKQLLKQINEIVDNDWGNDMVDGHLDLKKIKPNKPVYTAFTQQEAIEMSQALRDIYRISHTIYCEACREIGVSKKTKKVKKPLHNK